MLFALPSSAAISGPELACPFVVERRVSLAAYRPLSLRSGPLYGVIAWDQYMVGDLDLSGRFAVFASGRWRIDLASGKVSPFTLYMARKCKKYVFWPSAKDSWQPPWPKLAPGVETLPNLEPQAMTAVGDKGDRFWLSFTSHSAFGGAFGLVDFRNPELGSIYYRILGGPGRVRPGLWRHAQDSNAWLAYGNGVELRDKSFHRKLYLPNAKLDGFVVGYLAKRSLVYEVNDYQGDSRGGEAHASIQSVSAKVVKTLRRLPIAVPPGFRFLNSVVLPSRRLLVCLSDAKGLPTVASDYELLLSDKNLKLWKVIGHQFLRAASYDGRRLLITGSQVLEPAWVVRILE